LIKRIRLLNGESKGNIESFMTILPQVAIFLLSMQLISMQLFQSTGTYLENQDSDIPHHQNRNSNESNEIALIGGGKIISSTTPREHLSFFAKLTNIKSQTFSVRLDESSIS
jgi:hypothetical protein